MSNQIESNIMKQSSSRYPISNGLLAAVGDGARKTFSPASEDVLAICHVQGSAPNLHYFSTSFSGGPEWRV